jgi:hypothetical protein
MTTPNNPEPELTAPVDLCSPDGLFNRAARGWSRHPLHRCNVAPGLERKKKWNYWGITNGRVFLSTTIADMERLQVGSAYVVDFAKKRYVEQAATCPAGTIAIPEFPMGDMVFDSPTLHVDLLDEGPDTRIRIAAADFGGAKLAADVLVRRPPGHETLNDRETQFTSKQNTLPASGWLQWGDERWTFDEDAWGVLDFGRGVWPLETTWNWGSASGVQGSHTVGINLGGQWTDGTGFTENGFCVDGRLTKVSEDLLLEYDRTDWMKPWRVRSPHSSAVDLTFVPEFERMDTSGRRGTWFTEVHQLFGRYHGRIETESHGRLEIRDLFGWLEEHEARW